MGNTTEGVRDIANTEIKKMIFMRIRPILANKLFANFNAATPQR